MLYILWLGSLDIYFRFLSWNPIQLFSSCFLTVCLCDSNLTFIYKKLHNVCSLRISVKAGKYSHHSLKDKSGIKILYNIYIYIRLYWYGPCILHSLYEHQAGPPTELWDILPWALRSVAYHSFYSDQKRYRWLASSDLMALETYSLLLFFSYYYSTFMSVRIIYIFFTAIYF